MKALYGLASRLPLPRYYRTLLWSRTIARPQGDMRAWPYWRSVELALRGLQGHGASFPESASYSFLEFGVWTGKSLDLLVHYRDVLVRRLGIASPIKVYGFDTFEGLPAAREGDEGLPWYEGRFATDYAAIVERFAEARDVELVKGLFAETLPEYRQELEASPPLFVSVDCDWYSSTMDVLREVLPLASHGSLWYFDDVGMNYYSPMTGQMRAIVETNAKGAARLVEYPLHVVTGDIRHWKRLYRLARKGETAPLSGGI